MSYRLGVSHCGAIRSAIQANKKYFQNTTATLTYVDHFTSHFTSSAHLFGSTSGSSTMDIDKYATFSKNQYDAHMQTRDMLKASMERLAVRCKSEDVVMESEDKSQRRRLLLADLGSADGSSSLATLDFAVGALQSKYKKISDGSSLPLSITFEEHPASDEKKLQSTLSENKSWFANNDVTYDVLMKSFYSPLFERDSVDFLMSYICQHWLDTTELPDGESVSYWKSFGDRDREFAEDWVMINESSAPLAVQQDWKSKLADRHLAKFLSLRARELKPGAEMLLIMVGHPHNFITTGPLTRAMKRCIERGELRREVLQRTIVPYYLRTTHDIVDAVKVAKTFEIEDDQNPGRTETPGSMLDLIDCKSIPAMTRDDNKTMDGIFDLFWSIHVHSVKTADPSDDELESIKMETRRIFDEVFDAEEGVPSTFVACTLRKVAEVN